MQFARNVISFVGYSLMVIIAILFLYAGYEAIVSLIKGVDLFETKFMSIVLVALYLFVPLFMLIWIDNCFEPDEKEKENEGE